MDEDSENPAKLICASGLLGCVYGHCQEFDSKVLIFPVEGVGGGGNFMLRKREVKRLIRPGFLVLLFFLCLLVFRVFFKTTIKY